MAQDGCRKTWYSFAFDDLTFDPDPWPRQGVDVAVVMARVEVYSGMMKLVPPAVALAFGA